MTENAPDPAEFVGEGPAGDANPADFMSNDQSVGTTSTGRHVRDTDVTRRSSEPGDEQDEHETVNRESHPNAAGPDGLSGDMGLSSERSGGYEGIEGTGSAASAQGRTDGESPTTRVEKTKDPEPADHPVERRGGTRQGRRDVAGHRDRQDRGRGAARPGPRRPRLRPGPNPRP